MARVAFHRVGRLLVTLPGAAAASLAAAVVVAGCGGEKKPSWRAGGIVNAGSLTAFDYRLHIRGYRCYLATKKTAISGQPTKQVVCALPDHTYRCWQLNPGIGGVGGTANSTDDTSGTPACDDAVKAVVEAKLLPRYY
jgi:hypothetical protein